MRITRFALAWTFIAAVAAYDVYFAWRYRAVFEEWEMNPIALWIVRLWGLEAAAGLKAALLAFALGVGAYCHRCRHWLEVPYTLTISAIHFLLSLHYLVGLLP
jgi:hypothetical protein